MITEFGRSIASALSGLFNSPVTDARIERAIDEICDSLILSNVSLKHVKTLKDELRRSLCQERIPPGLNRAKMVQRVVCEKLVELLDPKVESYRIVKGNRNVVVFVGLQGSGKTTSVCKYANFYKKKGFRVGIVCADTFRAGAFDQIRQNALKIKVPFFGSGDADPVRVATEGVNRFLKDGFELILIDTSGRHTQESELFVEMKDIIRAVHPSTIVFVMDAGIGQSAEEQAFGFKKAVDVGSIFLTKVDGTIKAGGAISSVAAINCPIEFVGVGEGVEDIEVFEPKRVVSKMLGLGDVEGLVEKVGNLGIDEKEVLQKLRRGAFTLRDFYDQIQKILSLGPISKLLEMIPGVSMGGPLPDENVFRKLMCVFDSFSNSELDSDGQVFEKEPSRIMRAAIGSGTSTHGVSEILAQFKKMKAIMQKIASIPGIADVMSGDPSKMSLVQRKKLKQHARGFLPEDIIRKMGHMF